MKFKVFIIKK